MENGFNRARQDMIRACIDQGADINASFHKSLSLLAHAITKDHREMSAFLIECGSSLGPVKWKANTTFLMTPLAHALINKQYDMAAMLAEHTTPPDFTRDNGETLYCAVRSRRAGVVRTLLSKGATAPNGKVANSPLRHTLPWSSNPHESPDILHAFLDAGVPLRELKKQTPGLNKEDCQPLFQEAVASWHAQKLKG